MKDTERTEEKLDPCDGISDPPATHESLRFRFSFQIAFIRLNPRLNDLENSDNVFH